MLLRSPLLAHIPHGFSTRRGGVSLGPFASLNLGNPSDLPPERRDPPYNIRENFRRILHNLSCNGREIVEVHQVHGADIHLCLRGRPSHAGPRDTRADAIITDDPGRILAIRVADCAPVLLASHDGRLVAAVHAGWRGVVAGIAPAAAAAMRTLGATQLLAAIGPCIGPDHFEVGEEVASEFTRAFGKSAPIIRTGPKPRIDLKEALRIQLAQTGITRIDVSDRCTHRDADEFFSHRRDRGLTGRTAGFIGCAD